ncbi:peptidoglycan editing factor PgeF [Aerococcus sp. UMB7834]|uniref:peptidoglycan editing factor PgeF n=1 Tax=Aerococcus sp. UMB7834 TaxID=3046342 RepID=UPI00254BE8F7|nr:peptidoglycan editing factor PgeF [Aerococcus sp. UMB7834]MDK6805759.1 peptidoglycan editing factor PgeF [Aerococcus sp. UMB7834]
MTTFRYSSPSSIIALTSLRQADWPEEGNFALRQAKDKAGVVANRQRILGEFDLDLGQVVMPQQTHSAHCYQVGQEDLGRGARSAETGIADCDGLYTFDKGIIVGVLTADCVPVLFYEEGSGLVGAIHSGWRGTVQEISRKAFDQIKEAHPQVAIDQVQVHIGPALSQEKFEVQADAYQAFHALAYAEDSITYRESSQRWHIDNQAVVAKQCQLSGIPAANIHIHHHCTYQNPDSFSYRENGTPYRHGHLIVRV